MQIRTFLFLLFFLTGSYAMQLTSTAFQNNGWIPKEYTCEGKNIKPPLQWKDLPQGTQSLVLILSDPDAPMGTWDHWIVYNLPDHPMTLPNSWGKAEYDGPCPPYGTHHYVFDLYALDTLLDLPKDASKKILLEKMKSHIIDHAELIGLYKKK